MRKAVSVLIDRDLDRALEVEVEPYLRGRRRTAIRVEHVIRDWLRRVGHDGGIVTGSRFLSQHREAAQS